MSSPSNLRRRVDLIDGDQAAATALGEQLAEFLSLRPLQFGRYRTSWGTKTPAGLARSVLRILLKGIEE